MWEDTQVRNNLVNEVNCIDITDYNIWLAKLEQGYVGVQSGNEALMLFMDTNRKLRYLSSTILSPDLSVNDIDTLDWSESHHRLAFKECHKFIFNPRYLISTHARLLISKIIINRNKSFKEVIDIFTDIHSFEKGLI